MQGGASKLSVTSSIDHYYFSRLPSWVDAAYTLVSIEDHVGASSIAAVARRLVVSVSALRRLVAGGLSLVRTAVSRQTGASLA